MVNLHLLHFFFVFTACIPVRVTLLHPPRMEKFSYSSENVPFTKSLFSCITREVCLQVSVSLCLMEKAANYSGQLWSLVDQITVTLLSMAALFWWLIIRQREVHSGMIVSEFPLESVPASVELRFSSLPTVSAPLLITDLQMGTG